MTREQQRRRHQLEEEGSYRYRCSVCHWTWKRRTRSACPGVPRYSYEEIPDDLLPVPELHRRGLQTDQPADACYLRLKGEEPVWLFDVRKASPLTRPRYTPRNLITQAQTWLRERKNCFWCGTANDGSRLFGHLRLCEACSFEQEWLQERRAITRWAQRLFQRNDWAILDTETTGLGDGDEVVELAMLASDGTVMLDTLLRPQSVLSREVTFVHGLRNSDVRTAPAFPIIWPILLNCFRRAQKIIAYSADFHRQVLTNTAERYDLILPSRDWYCLMKIYATYWGKLRRDGQFQWQPLNNACRQQHVPGGWSPTHRALKDARKSFELLKALASKAEPHTPKGHYTLFGIR